MKRNHVLAAAIAAVFAVAGGAIAAGQQAAQVAAAPQPVKQSFDKLDTDKDGFLGHSEAAADRDAASRFRELDTNKDERISRAEYGAWQKSGSATAGATASNASTIRLQP